MTSIDIAGVLVPSRHFVDGNWIESQTTFPIRSPLDWSTPVGEMSLGSIETGAAAVEAARRAALAWSSIGAGERRDHMHRFADAIDELTDEIAAVEAIDTGILQGVTATSLVPTASGHLRSAAEMAVRHEQLAPVTRRAASGVSLVLTTWRSPFLSAVAEAAAALAAGNTVVLKPDEWAPLSTALLGRAAEAASLPPGVVNVVQGVSEAIGDSLVTSPAIDRLTLMGSLAAARNNAVMAARNLHPYRLEPAARPTYIVFEDADLEAAGRTAAGHFALADPGSLGGVRVLAARQIARALQEIIAEELRSLVPGDSRHIETTVPPLIHQQPHTRLHALVDRCRGAGDDVVVGGEPIDGSGLHFEPTLIRPRSRHSEAFAGEVVGPVVTFDVFDADHGSVAMTNTTDSPVIAAIYGAEPDRGAALAEELDCRLVRFDEAPVSETLAPIPGSSTPEAIIDFHSRRKTVSRTGDRAVAGPQPRAAVDA